MLVRVSAPSTLALSFRAGPHRVRPVYFQACALTLFMRPSRSTSGCQQHPTRFALDVDARILVLQAPGVRGSGDDRIPHGGLGEQLLTFIRLVGRLDA